MVEAAKHTEASVTQLLRAKYTGQEWAFVTKVPDGTGLAHSRTCDAMAMGLWPSKGLHLHGFEIKVSRSDWLKEIQDPSKSNAFAKHCHYWWIVAPPGVVKIDELAADWGLQEITAAGNLRVKRVVTFRSEPAPIGFAFLAGLFRACSRGSAEAELAAARRQGYEAGRDEGIKDARRWGEVDRDCAVKELECFKRSLKAFEEASGLKIDGYSGPKLGKLVAQIEAAGDTQTRLERLLRDVECLGTQLRSVIVEANNDT